MRTIVIVFSVLAVLTFATVGCLYIFGVSEFDQAVSLLAKAIATLVLLGACTALISVLMSGKGNGGDNQ